MATLYLIRHGQASFGADDYDKLSGLGCRQASVLGDYLLKGGIEFDAISGRPACSAITC
jgi:broad specificity phosphatase PhoE